MDEAIGTTWVDLYWLPLGAGGRSVRLNGRVYERIVALHEHRSPSDLFHAALLLRLDDITYAIEMGPVWNVDAADRGVVCQGPVGVRWLGRFRAFQYEVRCWPGGSIPDLAEAVASPSRVSTDHDQVRAVLDSVRQVPALIWGRDEVGCGDMLVRIGVEHPADEVALEDEAPERLAPTRAEPLSLSPTMSSSDAPLTSSVVSTLALDRSANEARDDDRRDRPVIRANASSRSASSA